MKTSEVIVFAIAIIGAVACVAIGAWLAFNNHPWFALLAMLIGGCMRVRISNEDCKCEEGKEKL